MRKVISRLQKEQTKHLHSTSKISILKKHFLTEKQEKKIVKAIRNAERKTTGEIRVHITFEHSEDHYERAVNVFEQLNMSETQDRNAVLFHVCLSDKNLTVIGDLGIHRKIPKDYWQKITHKVSRKFKKKKYAKGLVLGIEMCGQILKEYFPSEVIDINELPDEISLS